MLGYIALTNLAQNSGASQEKLVETVLIFVRRLPDDFDKRLQ